MGGAGGQDLDDGVLVSAHALHGFPQGLHLRGHVHGDPWPHRGLVLKLKEARSDIDLIKASSFCEELFCDNRPVICSC